MFIINCIIIFLAFMLEVMVVFCVLLFCVFFFYECKEVYSSYKMRKRFREFKNIE